MLGHSVGKQIAQRGAPQVVKLGLTNSSASQYLVELPGEVVNDLRTRVAE